jgi:uncharacterized delta-60 repeat protein
MPAVACVMLLAVMLASSGSRADAASSSVVVTLDVASATYLGAGGCANGTPGVTDFGTLQPGTKFVSGDCNLVFGSSNDTSSLQVAQGDGIGLAMWQPTRGVVDTTGWGTLGSTNTPIGPTTAIDYAVAGAVQPDGKVLQAGYCDMGATGDDYCVARYLTSGAPDPGFGGGSGFVATPMGLGAGADDTLRTMLLQDDGYILLAGDCTVAGNGLDMCISRYEPDGDLDPNWGVGGIIREAFSPGGFADIPFELLELDDGRILAAGECVPAATGADLCVVRFEPDGDVDPTFGTAGVASVTIGPGLNSDTASAIVRQEDGKLIVAGQCDMGAGTLRDFCSTRLEVDGAVDNSWGTLGKFSHTMVAGARTELLLAMSLDPQGRAVVAGYCDVGGGTGIDSCVARYTTLGALDGPYGTGGRAITAAAPGALTESMWDVEHLADGRAYVAGNCEMSAGNRDFCILRYRTDGSLDPSFGGGDGIVTVARATVDYLEAIGQLSDGRLAAMGRCNVAATGYDFCTTVFDDGGAVSQYVGTTTDWDTPDTSLFAACLQALSGGTPVWSVSATCPDTDGAWWNAVPPSATNVATTLAPGNLNATLRFGVRTRASQPPGTYLAPITISVIAPG